MSFQNFEWLLKPEDWNDGHQSKFRSANFDAGTGRPWFLELDLGDEENPAIRLGLESVGNDIEIRLCFRLILKDGDRALSETTDYTVFTSSKLKSDPYCFREKTLGEQHKICVVFLEHKDIPLVGEFVHIAHPHHAEKTLPNFLLFLKNGNLHDLILEAEGEEIKCHKSVLCWSSSYFDTMLRYGPGDVTRIAIVGFDPDTIKTMVDFLYTLESHKLPIASEMSLLKAAEKYQLPDLKDICESHLIPEINLSKAVEVLVQADIHSVAKMKKLAMDFICENLAHFMESCELLQQTRLNLHRELLVAIARAK